MAAGAQILARLLAPDSRGGCLDELEAAPGRAAGEGALTAVLGAMASADADHREFQRMGMLLVSMSYEGDGQPGSLIGAACAEGRLQALYSAPTVVARRLHSVAAADLTADDAISYVCLHSWVFPGSVSGVDEQFGTAAGIKTIPDVMPMMWCRADPLSVGGFPASADPAVPLRIAELILEMIKEPPGQRLPELARPPAMIALFLCAGVGSPLPAHNESVAVAMLEGGIVELVVAEIEATKCAGRDWTSATDMRAASPGFFMWFTLAVVMPVIIRTQSPEYAQGLRERFVSSGLFRLSLEAMSHFADKGVEAAADAHMQAMYFLLKVPNFCRDEPGCEEEIRAHATALTFCMENNLFAIRSMHGTTAQAACQLAANVFGRDDDSVLTFSDSHVAELMNFWLAVVNAEGSHKMFPPSAEYLTVGHMCKSDDNKVDLTQAQHTAQRLAIVSFFPSSVSC